MEKNFPIFIVNDDSFNDHDKKYSCPLEIQIMNTSKKSPLYPGRKYIYYNHFYIFTTFKKHFIEYYLMSII